MIGCVNDPSNPNLRREERKATGNGARIATAVAVSVIIPCRNAGRWIGEALNSIAAQTFAPFEVIVVDDGSTDDSLARIKSSGIAHKLLHTRRVGGSGARNAGIEAATGDWIAFLDADDCWYPDHLQRAMALVSGSGDVAYLARCDIIYADGEITLSDNPWPIAEPQTGLTSPRFLELFSRRIAFAMSSTVIRREHLRAVGMLDPSQTRRHDIDMWLRVIHGQTWAYDPAPANVYRRDTPGAISRNIANGEYFFLRCLLRNRTRHRGEAMERLIRRASRSAMSAAFTDGELADRRRATELAWPHLSRTDRRLFGSVCFQPWIFRGANRLRRQLLGIGRKRDQRFRRRADSTPLVVRP